MKKRGSFTTNLDKEIIQKLKTRAIMEDRFANDIIEDALRDYFEKIEKESDLKLNIKK